jgi:hypothetical protein
MPARKDNDVIPETADEALAMWDAGKTLFTVEMGGLGPGYEQAIQCIAFELIRDLRGCNFTDKSKANRDAIFAKRDETINRIDAKLGGVTGAMVGAATGLAFNVIRRGYRAALRDPAVAHRLIQVSKNFPPRNPREHLRDDVAQPHEPAAASVTG